MRAVYLMIITFVALLAVSGDSLAAKQSITKDPKAITYSFGHQYQIQSEILSENRQLNIYLPEEYSKSSAKLPVIYILEGDKHYKHATITIEKIQTSGWIPASVIVAITDNKGTNMRDYVHKSDNFLNFINQEVQPFMVKNFRVNDYKTLYGHARSGTFVLETLIKNPKEFDNYIAANPIIRQGTIDRFESLLNNNKKLNQSLYFTMGTVQDNGAYNVDPVEKLAELLKTKAPQSLQWHYQYLPLHGFHSSANISLFDGLSATFKDYQGPFIYSYQDFVDGNGMKGVKDYFSQRANKYHTSDEVTLGTFMGLGFMFMDGGHPKEAVELITNAIKDNFSQSIELHRVLGRAYEKLEAYQKAVDTYQTMVTLAKQQNSPRLDDYQNQLELVKKKI